MMKKDPKEFGFATSKELKAAMDGEYDGPIKSVLTRKDRERISNLLYDLKDEKMAVSEVLTRINTLQRITVAAVYDDAYKKGMRYGVRSILKALSEQIIKHLGDLA